MASSPSPACRYDHSALNSARYDEALASTCVNPPSALPAQCAFACGTFFFFVVKSCSLVAFSDIKRNLALTVSGAAHTPSLWAVVRPITQSQFTNFTAAAPVSQFFAWRVVAGMHLHTCAFTAVVARRRYVAFPSRSHVLKELHLVDRIPATMEIHVFYLKCSLHVRLSTNTFEQGSHEKRGKMTMYVQHQACILNRLCTFPCGTSRFHDPSSACSWPDARSTPCFCSGYPKQMTYLDKICHGHSSVAGAFSAASPADVPKRPERASSACFTRNG